MRINGQLMYGSPVKPLITVGSVVSNGKDILEDTILSIINQSDSNLELSLSTEVSEDARLDIIWKYEGATSYGISEKI